MVIPLFYLYMPATECRAGSRNPARERKVSRIPSWPLPRPSLPHSPAQSYNRLQLPRVPERVLDHGAAGAHDVLVRRLRLGLLLREVDAAVLGQPAARLRKLHHGALGVEEEQVLGVRDGQGRVGALRAGRDFGADGGDEDLRGLLVRDQCW